MKSKEFIGGAFWLCVALVIIQQSLQLKMGSYRTPGPGYIPLGVGLGMVVLSVAIMARALRTAAGPGSSIKVSKSAFQKVGLVLSGLLVYALCFPYLGFPVTTFVLLLLLFKGGDPRGWVKQIGLAAGSTVFAYFLFNVLLSCELPRGVFGF